MERDFRRIAPPAHALWQSNTAATARIKDIRTPESLFEQNENFLNRQTLNQVTTTMNSYWRFLVLLLWTATAQAGSVPVYRIETVAGSALMGDGGAAAMAQIGSIQGIAVDH